MGLMEEQTKTETSWDISNQDTRYTSIVGSIHLWIWLLTEASVIFRASAKVDALSKRRIPEWEGRRLKRYDIPQTGVTYAAIYHSISYHGVNVTYNYIVCVCDLSIPKPPGTKKTHA